MVILPSDSAKFPATESMGSKNKFVQVKPETLDIWSAIRNLCQGLDKRRYRRSEIGPCLSQANLLMGSIRTRLILSSNLNERSTMVAKWTKPANPTIFASSVRLWQPS
jgi:hypothetical protein